MLLTAGLFLKSTPALNNSLFENTIVFITENNSSGAIGFIINKSFGRKLNELEEFKHSPSFLLYYGGPVDKEHLFFIHQRPNLINDGVVIADKIFVGSNFNQAINCINNKRISSNDIKLFIGYCGWDAGELESEVEEGSWKCITNADPFMQ